MHRSMEAALMRGAEDRRKLALKGRHFRREGLIEQQHRLLVGKT